MPILEPVRRDDVSPLTWELPLLGVFVAVIAAALALPTGQGIAAVLTGHGWLWPTSAGLFPSVAGLLTGHPGRGLSPGSSLPPAALTYICAVLAAGVVASTAGLLLRQWWTASGPGSRPGLASSHEVEQILGEARARKVRKVIRPDLYGRSDGNRRG